MMSNDHSSRIFFIFLIFANEIVDNSITRAVMS